ncbi:MAG TPA: S-methyl-5-thioribose-1-phosphate isomerase [Calditrichaeota bacterium]|nr:S-methyl-5-thioribose-1-phosphate isomerase [Calditrichota bacterium]
METIRFERGKLTILDQSSLPNHVKYIELNTLDDVFKAIKHLKVRGAPAIGITAAYGLYLHAKFLYRTRSLTSETFYSAVIYLKGCRPTAKNLPWAVNKMYTRFEEVKNRSQCDVLDELKITAETIHEEDRIACENIGFYGNELLRDGANILTHCNAGILATGGIGTALAPVYTAINQGKKCHVYVDETRPVGQGARLTYWELMQNRISATLITDNMAGYLMSCGEIDLVCVGADRISANGDVANKIGTYSLAVLADYHKIPFYVLAPFSTFDMNIAKGTDISIEHRAANEVTRFWKINKELNYQVKNPAFDVTPHSIISAIITDKGVIHKPNKKTISHFFNF